MVVDLGMQGAVEITKNVHEFLVRNRAEAAFFVIGVLISFSIAYYFYKLGKPKFKPERYFSYYKRVKDLTPGDLRIQKYHGYYYDRPSNDQISTALTENKYVLVVGRPKSGKTRAVFEAIKQYSEYYVYTPFPRKMDISEIDSKKIKKKVILFFDDLNEFTRKFLCHELLKRLEGVCSDLIIMATCRTGEEEAELKKDREMVHFVSNFERVELEDISREEGKTIAENARVNFSESEFDCTVGSVFLGLSAMKDRYGTLCEEEKVLLRLMKIITKGETYSIEKSILKELFHYWIEYERINMSYSFDSCLYRLIRDSFLIERSGFVSSSYSPYLEIIEYEVSGSDLLELKKASYELKYVEGLVNVGFSFFYREEFQEAINCFSEAIELDEEYMVAFFGRGLAYAGIGEPEKVISDFDEVMKTHPEIAEICYIRGAAYGKLGEYEKALSDYNEAIRINPEYADAYIRRGLIYDNSGEYEKALSDYNEAIRINPEYALVYYNRGLTYSHSGEYEKALSDYNEAIRINPEYALVYYSRGLIYSHSGEYEKALSDYNEAIRINPEYADAYIRRGVIYSLSGEYEKALSDYNEAIRINPEFASAYYGRGLIYSHSGEYEKALSDYNEAIRINPEFADAYYNRGVIYDNSGEYEKALSDYNEAIRINPEFADAYYNRGLTYSLSGEYEKALSDYNEAIRINPEDADAYYGRGVIYDNSGEYEKALSDYNEAIRINPEYADAYYSRGLIYSHSGEYEKALFDYNEAIRINPEDADAYYSRGLIYSLSGEYEKALSDYNEAIRINPEFADAYYGRGLIYDNSGEYEKALSDYNEAIRINPEDADVWLELGRVYEYREDFEKAKECFERVVEMTPENAEGWSSLGYLYSDHLFQYTDAIRFYEIALQFDPEEVTYEASLAEAFFCSENFEKSLALAQDILSRAQGPFVQLNMQLLVICNFFFMNRVQDAMSQIDEFQEIVKNLPKEEKNDWTYSGIKHVIGLGTISERHKNILFSLIKTLENLI